MEIPNITDMQMIKEYPPEVEACRGYCFDLMKLAEAEMLKEAETLRLLSKEHQSQERRRIQERYIKRCAPFVEELSRLEMFAQISFVMKRAPEGEVVAR